ncbi:hypothetical protein EDB89DRAFT_1950027 [Lactarius sanguifluus]|nr:hypothetical protein EDB89DRAFT_1950027 [Lactarius sanguifluus]
MRRSRHVLLITWPWFVHCTLTHNVSSYVIKNHQSGDHLAIKPGGITFRLRPPCPNPRREISVAMLTLPALIGGKRLPPVGNVLGSVRSFISIKGASVNAWRPRFFVGYEVSTTAVRAIDVRSIPSVWTCECASLNPPVLHRV